MKMQNLEDFPVPDDGQISLCEINGQMQCALNQNATIFPFTSLIEKHPSIFISRESLHSTSSYNRGSDDGRSLFLPVKQPFLKQLTQIYHEQGALDALRTLTAHEHPLVSKSARLLLYAVSYFNKAQLILKNPSLRYNGRDLLNELSQSRNWDRDSIRVICWHPYVTKVAIATGDDSVRIYCAGTGGSHHHDDGGSGLVPLLRCKQQKNVTCLAWRPNSITDIAVGHENGIIVWSIDSNSLVARPSIGNAIILHRFDHRPIISVVWSPTGNLLLSASPCQSAIIVWDVELDSISRLQRSGATGTGLLRWSPRGDKLFSSTDSIIFRIWNCARWECERWTILNGRVQSACWSNCGSTLLFATSNEPIIYGLAVKNDLVFTSDVDTSANQAVPLYDLTKIDLNCGGVTVGGLVRSMECDPLGGHLAVLFRDTNCVAVFNVVRQQCIQLIPSSLIVGFPEETPSAITFQLNFKAGACLTIGWSSGRVQYYPIVYTDLGGTNLDAANQNDNGQSFYTSF